MDILATNLVGRKYATRVRISSPSGSCFDGAVGVVIKFCGDTAFVQFPLCGRLVVLPFALSELAEARYL